MVIFPVTLNAFGHFSFGISRKWIRTFLWDKTDPWKYCWVAFYASPDLLPTLFSHSSDLYICKKINAQYIKNIFFKILAKHFAFQDHHRLEEEFSSSYLNLSANMDISFSFDLAAALYVYPTFLFRAGQRQTKWNGGCGRSKIT